MNAATLLRLSVDGTITRLTGNLPTLDQLRKELRDESIVAETVTPTFDIWCSVGAMLEATPVLNIAAMWLLQNLRGVLGMPVIWGDVLLVAHNDSGEFAELDTDSLTLINHFLAA